MKVECLAPQGSVGKVCPLCTAAANGNSVIGKAKTRIFVPMLAAYRNAAGVLSAPVPVIWDAAANARQDYAKALATKLYDFKDLRAHVFVLRRHGQSLDTSYSIDYVPTFDSEEYVPADFSAFEGFNIAKHSYWVKSFDEINTFLTTGSFPAVQRTQTAQPTVSVPKVTVPSGGIPVKTPDAGHSNYTTPTPAAIPTPAETPASIPTPAPTPAEETPVKEPTRNFGGGFGKFSF